MVGTSFAFFNYVGKGSKENIITAGTLTFSYSDAGVAGNGIKIENQLPTSDANGKMLMGTNNVFNFSINANTTGAPVNYEVVAEKLSKTTLREDRVKIYLTDITVLPEKPIGRTILNDQVIRFSE
ncbi:MAG: hypothetical protein RSA50_08955, partial [Mucinivorans sp.]